MTPWPLALPISLLAASVIANQLDIHTADVLIERRSATAFTESSVDVESQHYLPLRSGGPSRSSKLLTAANSKVHDAQLSSLLGGTEFTVPVEIWNESFQLIVDTGSSDTWVMRKGFQCYTVREINDYDYEYVDTAEATCAFGPTYNGTFEGGPVANENFNITYGSGEFVVGVMGHSHVTVAGITVIHQEIALGTKAYFQGDNITSGILGLAYEGLTSAYRGTNAALDTTKEEYSPIFKSMYTQNLTAPTFSLALERTNSTTYEAPGGYIAFGGYPPVSFVTPFISTPIEVVQVASQSQQTTQNTFYAITPDGWVGGRGTPTTTSNSKRNSKRSTSTNHNIQPPKLLSHATPATHATSRNPQTPTYIVDSGTTLNYLPPSLTYEISTLYNPPAIYIPSYGLFFALCSATPPVLGARINGTDFYIDGSDLIVQSEGFDYGDEDWCLTGVQSGGEDGPYILGDVFLVNVLAVFDVGAGMMRFAKRSA